MDVKKMHFQMFPLYILAKSCLLDSVKGCGSSVLLIQLYQRKIFSVGTKFECEVYSTVRVGDVMSITHIA